MKQIATIILTCIIGMSMTLTPALMAEHAYADDAQDQAAGTAVEAENAVETEDAAEAENAVETEDSAEAEGTVDVKSTEDPAVDPEETAESGVAEGAALEGLAGRNISDIENDPELCALLDDPTFYRYYEVDEDGVIWDKVVDMDEVERFIMEADANAEGIDDVDNVETAGDLTAMGGGVTGLGKGQTPSRYASYNRYHCIDVSWWQHSIDWKKAKAAGVTHAFIRCGYSALRNGKHNMDSTFASNVNGAYNAGVKVGVYYYSTAVNASEAASEAQYVSTLLKNYRSKITLPVAFDYETGGRLTSKVMKSTGTASCSAFCDTIKGAGYEPMVYANYVTLTKYIDYKTLENKYKIWLANYTTNGTATTYPGKYWMWQYSSSGKVNGLSGRVDINYIFEPKTSSPAPAATAKPAAKPAGYKAVTTGKMNYRTGPSTKKKIKGSYKKGTTVYIKSFHGNWAKMTNGYYINRSHLKYKAKTTDSVNYRTGPGTKYKKKGTYKKGVTVTIVKVKGGWAKMSNGKWLSVKYTKIQKQ